MCGVDISIGKADIVGGCYVSYHRSARSPNDLNRLPVGSALKRSGIPSCQVIQSVMGWDQEVMDSSSARTIIR
ncbi:hypothetical protein E6O75_ATG05221 [Venturia nashicola]|uniref:Uncharacterized protein n=1 Tax=Venturia nashicola TaxID=86259 RepID=A0A4Z1PAV7_9PEZI|nr:hypothetical protein E6O75_ATG05221 [Venturia nashicola]